MNPEMLHAALVIERRLRDVEPDSAHLRALRAATRPRHGRRAARLTRWWPAARTRSVA